MKEAKYILISLGIVGVLVLGVFLYKKMAKKNTDELEKKGGMEVIEGKEPTYNNSNAV